MVGDDVVTEGDETGSGKWLGHSIGFLGTGLCPDEFELLVSTAVVVTEEVVTDTDVSGVL